METTLFSVAVHDSCGNTLTGASLVTVLQPSVDFTYTYLRNRLLQFNSTASADVVSYFWDFGDGGTSTEADPQHDFADTGYFNVVLTVTNAFGCTDTAMDQIYAYPDFVFYIPNTFTPNVDGLNDVFSGKGMGFTDYEMLVFDRWGEEIYKTNDIHRGWPGTTSDDVRCQIGVYAYKVQLTTPPGQVYTYIGHINLIR
jgi:gliding motility-associated-like protein